MNVDSQSKKIVSAFPLPPSCYVLFTDERKIEEISPPAIPSNGFTYFGIKQNSSASRCIDDYVPMSNYPCFNQESLEEFKVQNVVQDGKAILKDIIHIITRTLSALVQNQALVPECIEDFRRNLTQLYHLTNIYRSHQSREILINELKSFIQTRTEEIEKMKELILEIQTFTQEVEKDS